MDPKIIKKTQDSLGKIIKKPPLTEKLLNKPPFRFLHDIITEIIRTTDFMDGLFSLEEMDSKNVTSKEAKIGFLQKLIDCVTAVTGEKLAVRPNKVIAGHEPEHTNILLQTIASCIEKKLPYADAVKATLTKKIEKKASKNKIPDGKKGEATTGHKEEKKKSKPDTPTDKTKEKNSEHRKRSASKLRNDAEKTSRKLRAENEEADSVKSKSQEKLEKEKLKEQEREKRRKDKKRREEKELEESQGMAAEKELNDVNQAVSTTTSRGPRPASAKGQRRKPSQPTKKEPKDETSDGEATAASRPKNSVRPGAPKIKQRGDVQGEIDSGAPERTAPIIIDNRSDETHSDDDDAQFLVKQEAAVLDHTTDAPSDGGITTESDDEHGGLVRKILKTKEELEQSAAGSHAVAHHTEIERSTLSAQQKKEREMVVREIEVLRNSVQKLCQSVAPLAKIIDYIQEDMDSMQNELSFWKNENQQHAQQLKEEEIKTQRSIEHLHHELQEMDRSIIAYRNQMAATKANIIKNDEKIRKMVVAVATRA